MGSSLYLSGAEGGLRVRPSHAPPPQGQGCGLNSSEAIRVRKPHTGRDWRYWLIGFMAGSAIYALAYWILDRYF